MKTIKIERKNDVPRVQLKLVTRKQRRLSDNKKNQDNLMQILLYSNATPIRNKDSLGYGCAFCSEQFIDPKNLKKHFLAEHHNDRLIRIMSNKLFEHVVKLDITYLHCALCNKNITQLDELMVHLKSEHRKELHTDIKSSIVPFSFDTPQLQCAVCKIEYSNFKLLQEHMNSHFGNNICAICGGGFVTERLLTTHMKRHKTGEYKCEDCDKIFDNEEKIKEHQKRAHLGHNKRNKCLICEERFVDYWKKIEHMVEIHGAPPVVLKCQACDRSFRNQRALSRHTKKDHLMERKNKCPECEMRFFSKSSLQRHMAKHTGIRQFTCDVCFKSYGRKNTLREHMRIHADDRRFACSHCGQAFVQKCSWRSHMRIKHDDQETETTNVKRNPETRKVMKNVKNKRLNLRVKSNNQKEVTKHQSNLREILLNSNATPIRCRGGIGYACCFCSEQFPEAANLKKHTLDTHGDDEKANFMKDKEMFGFFVKMDITGLKCKLCEENIDGLEKLVDHLRDVHEKYFFTDIKNHILPFKFQDEILECVVCSNVFNTFKALQEHMNVHYRNYICKICDAGFVNKNILLRHGDAHKTGTFTCEICSKTFDTARKRLLHSRAHHPGKVLPHKCGYCQERFHESRKKQEHLLTKHGIKPTIIKCNDCDKTFDRKHSWRMHSTRVHLMVRDFKCSVCEREFYTKVELENHMVKHTGTKKFKCALCSKGYGRHKTLIEHIKKAHLTYL